MLMANASANGLAVGVAIGPKHFAQPVLLGLGIGQGLQLGVGFGTHISVCHKVPTPMRAFFDFLLHQVLSGLVHHHLLFSFDRPSFDVQPRAPSRCRGASGNNSPQPLHAGPSFAADLVGCAYELFFHA